MLGTGRAAEPESSYHLLSTIKVGGEGGWDYLTVDAASRRLYLSRSNRVMVVDVDQGKVVGEVKNTPGIHGIAIASRQKKGYTSNGGDSTVTVFDLETLKETARIKAGNVPDPIIYDPASDRVFTFNARSMDATAIDTETDKVRDRWPLAPGKTPSGIAMDRSKRHLFVTCRNEKMVVLDADKGKVVATLNIGKGTDAAAFDPGTGLAFSSNGDGTLNVVGEKMGEYHVLANVKTQNRAKTMALDTKTHRVFLPAAKYKEGSRSPEPGSFVILVFGMK
jgi:DNA-binding beta-propeller fold protein YncE